MAKEAYYFSHDANARQDEKILMLRAEHGWEGYGIYWALIEMMFESSDSVLNHSKIKGIAVSYNIDITLLQSVINTCISEELFNSDNEHFWSESLTRRKTKFLDSKAQKSEAGSKGMAKRWGNRQPMDNDVNNGVITENNKGKESKESKVKKQNKTLYAEQVLLLESEYEKVVEKYGNEENAKWAIDKLSNYKCSKSTKYKSDYHVLIGWVYEEFEKKKPSTVVAFNKPKPVEKEVPMYVRPHS